MTEEKIRENRVRRMAQRQGLLLFKSRRRDPNAIDYGGFILADERNHAILGTSPHAYSATIDEVEEYLTTDKGER